jgi:hypothetical protein
MSDTTKPQPQPLPPSFGPMGTIRTADDLRRYIIESVDEWINKPIIRRFLSQEGVDVAKAQREYWRQADDVQVNLLLSILNKG